MIHKDDYQVLAAVLKDALDQAQSGKGKERHAKGRERFEDQQIMEIPRRQGNISGLGFQVHKKAYEAEGMFARGEYAAAMRELYGVINYAGAMVALVDEIYASAEARKVLNKSPLHEDTASNMDTFFKLFVDEILEPGRPQA